MGDKTAGAPQETIVDVMVEMLSDSEGTTTQAPAWMAACKHYRDRLSLAALPKFPELDITSIPKDGIVVVIPPEPITTSQAMMLRDAIRCAKAQSLPDTKFIVLQHGTTIQALADEDLARLGLQHIPAA